MKIKNITMILILVLTLVGCSGDSENLNNFSNIIDPHVSDTIEDTKDKDYKSSEIYYYNFSNEELNEHLKSIFVNSGISLDIVEKLYSRIQFFNKFIEGDENFKDGFVTSNLGDILKKTNKSIINDWEKADLDYLDYNSRVIAFGLYRNYINVEGVSIEPNNNLVFDLDMLNRNPLSDFSEEDINDYISLYAPIATEETNDVNFHLNRIKYEWNKRGVKFEENESVSMINIFYHYPELDELAVGHSAVLIDYKDGFYLVEKLGMYLPYQITRFSTIKDVYDFLVAQYNVWHGDKAINNIIMKDLEQMVY